jgi:hypothetical protein
MPELAGSAGMGMYQGCLKGRAVPEAIHSLTGAFQAAESKRWRPREGAFRGSAEGLRRGSKVLVEKGSNFF